MPWYAGWSDKILKRICKYLLQKYLGKFLEEKVALDQLDVNLHDGVGTITDVALDVLALNELAEQQNIPLQFLDGFIEEFSVSIPWSAILSDAVDVNVHGLVLTVKYKERDKPKASMFESMWSSMSSSQQLAEDCMRNEKENPTEDTSQSFEGIERFTQLINSILSRMRIKFTKTVLRLEEEIPNTGTGVAIEVTIENLNFWDEAGETTGELVIPLFSTKKLVLEGVAFYSDEFTCDISPPIRSTQDFPYFLDHSMDDDGMETSVSEMEAKTDVSEKQDNSVLLARLAGSQQISIQFRNETVAGPKIELTLRLGAFTAFASPRQVHKLVELLNVMSSKIDVPKSGKTPRYVEKPMDESDFRKIEQDLATKVNQAYLPQSHDLDAKAWGNLSMDDSCDFQSLNNMSRYNESVRSSASSLASSTSSLGSSSSRSNISQSSYSYSDARSAQHGAVDVDLSSAVFRFYISLSSVAIVLLHDDILVVPTTKSSSTSPNRDSSSDSSIKEESTSTRASCQAMKNVAEEFFKKLGHFALSGFGNKDFHDAKSVFLKACQHNHLRFLAAPVIIEGNESLAQRGSVIKGCCTAASVQLLECLVQKNGLNGECASNTIELLTFTKNKDSDDVKRFESAPSFKLDFKFYESSRRDKGRRIKQPRSDLNICLQPVEIEFDLTLIDRISTLLNFEKPFKPSSGKYHEAMNLTELKNVLDNTIHAKTRHNIRLSSSFLSAKIRFPIPDLRPLHDMDRAPWWQRNVRDEVLLLDLTDISFQTALDPLDPIGKYDVQCRKLVAKFQESEADAPVPFVTIAADPASNTIIDGGQGFGWPRLELSFYPENKNLELEMEEPTIVMAQSMGHMSLIAALERTQEREVSPFSFQRVINDNHGDVENNGEELVTPGNKQEIAEFLEVASFQSRLKIEIYCPTTSILLQSKRLYELIYNRITMDLLMWKPSAPVNKSEVNNKMDDFSYGTNSPVQESFNICKSAIHFDSDSDDDSQENMFFSVAEQKERHRKKKEAEDRKPRGQSKISVCMTVGKGLCDIYLPVRDSQGNIIPEQCGEILLAADEVTYFYVSGFNGKKDLDYMCVQGNHLDLYHTGLLTESCNSCGLRSVDSPIPHYLLPTLMRMDSSACPEPTDAVGIGSAQSLDMLTAAVKVSRDEYNRSLKFFRVAVGLRNTALRYRVFESRNIWYNQFIDFFDVDDYPIAGYEPSTVVTELNLHLWNCNIDYRPLYLPLRSVLNFGSFNISSNITKSNSSTLRFIAEDASFFVSTKMGHRPQSCPVNLRKDYVCVMQLALFDLFVRLCELTLTNPRLDLKASANSLVLRTCADSAKALMELLAYFAADTDLHGCDVEVDLSSASSHVHDEEILVTTDEEPAHLLSKSQVERVHDLMEEAMKESRSEKKPGSRVYFTTDNVPENVETDEIVVDTEDTVIPPPPLGSDLSYHDEQDDSWENEFCILENEAGIGILPKSGLPEVRQLTLDPPHLVENHFALPTGRTDHLMSPKHYPRAVLRYTLRELSLLWQMYGGCDFGASTPPKHVNIRQPFSDDGKEAVSGSSAISFSKKSPTTVRFEAPLSSTTSSVSKLSWVERGGPGRRHDVLMELQLNKVQFQHEVYPDYTDEVSRQVLLIKDLELRDRLESSQFNKFLYQYYSEAKPKQAHANMVVVKALQIRSDPKVNAQECSLKVSLLPLRLNIDQDSLLFLVQFFTDISVEIKEETAEEETPQGSRHQTPTHAPPVMSVTTEDRKEKVAEPVPTPAPPLIQLEDPRPTPKIKNRQKRSATPSKPPSPPIFFRCVIFSPEVPVKLDYQGKFVDLTHGPLAGILLGLGQLNNSELRLKRITHRHGLLGLEKLIQFILSEWSADLKRNQLPGLLGGVGPIHSLVQLFQGVRDLFWMPIEQYQKDGRLVRGFQRGASSFTTSSAMAVLELTSRLIQLIQSTAETAYDMVSPGPSVRSLRRSKDKRRQYSQPADIREGVANAILVVKHGIGETAVNLVRVASEEHEQKGVTGAVGGVLRQIPPTVVKPIILATEATNNVIGGMRSQLVPDVRKEAVDKWRTNDK